MPALGGLSWTRDGRGVVFYGDEDGGGTFHLWRAAADGKRSVERIEAAGMGVGPPSMSPSSDRLLFSRVDSDVDMYRFQPGKAPAPFASSSSDDEFPAWSNDGRQIAFASDRTGSMEVWVASSDGSAVRQLTSGPNHQQRAPRWSPDDKRIAFESQGADGHFHVWVTDVNAGPPRQVTIGAGDQSGPTWSRDGRWIYFSADTGHGWDIWRVQEAGGPEEQVTHGGSGYVAFESFDGKNILYQQKTTPSALLLQPLAGGPPRQVVACASADVFTMNKQGVYYVPCNPGPDTPLHVLDPVTSKDRVVGTLVQLDMPTQADLAVSPDGSTVLYCRRAIADRADLWMIEHFK